MATDGSASGSQLRGTGVTRVLAARLRVAAVLRLKGAVVGILALLFAALVSQALAPAALVGTERPLLAYARGGGLFAVNDDSSGARRLIAPRSRVESFAWAPDGRRIVVARSGVGLSVLAVSTRKLKTLTTGSSDGSPDWSRNGKRIAFSRGDYGEIWTVSPAGKAARRVVEAYDAYAPEWSPDSRKIAFDWDAGDSYNAFAVVNADGRGRVNVGADGDNVWGPHWSPDSHRIVFTRAPISGGADPEPSPSLWLMNSDGTNQHPLITDASANGAEQELPAWSPDGGRIAFGSGGQIDVVNTDGSQRTTLATNGYAPKWSPDGTEIAFTRPRGNVTDLFVMNADGSNPHRLATGPVTGFAWKPK